MSDQKQNGSAAPQTLTLTPQQLQEMLLTFAKELRKPADPTEAELAEMESNKQIRRETAKLQLAKIENKRAEQKACLHIRPSNNTSTCVFLRDMNALICQQCQGFIHPEPRPSEDSPLFKEFADHIYDTQLFNRHFLLTQTQTTF